MKLGPGLIRKARVIRNIANIPLQIGKRKIFCISMQKNGTTSVGDFLAGNKFRVARHNDSWENQWTYKCSVGDYESIFNSLKFRSCQAYEDDPWWYPDFYRVLNYRFPNSKFILFYRDSDAWFNSMVSHSNGKTLGNTYRHCRTYRRLTEYYNKLENDPDFKPTKREKDNLMLIDEGLRDHYKNVYEEYNKEAIEYFKKHAPGKLFVCRLEDESKWIKLGEFLGINVNPDLEIHSNKSNRKLPSQVDSS